MNIDTSRQSLQQSNSGETPVSGGSAVQAAEESGVKPTQGLASADRIVTHQTQLPANVGVASLRNALPDPSQRLSQAPNLNLTPQMTVLISEAQAVLNPIEIQFSRLVDVANGPPDRLEQLIEAMSNAVYQLTESGAFTPSALKLIAMLTKRLKERANHIKNAVQGFSVSNAELAAARTDVVKMLKTMLTLALNPQNEALGQVFEAIDIEIFRPLVSGEMMVALHILIDRGDESGRYEELRQCKRFAALSSQKKVDALMLLARDLDRAENDMCRDEALEDIRIQLRHSDAVQRRESESFWQHATDQADASAVRLRLTGLQAEVTQRGRFVDLLAAQIDRQQKFIPQETVGQVGLQQSVQKARELLVKITRFIDMGLEIGGRSRKEIASYIGTGRQIMRDMADRAKRGLPHLQITVEPISISEMTKQVIEKQAVLGHAAEVLLRQFAREEQEFSLLDRCCASSIEATIGRQIETITALCAGDVRLRRSQHVVLDRAREAVAIAAQLGQEEEAAIVLAEQVRRQQAQGFLYLWLNSEHSALEHLLPELIAQIKARVEQRESISTDASDQRHIDPALPASEDSCSAVADIGVVPHEAKVKTESNAGKPPQISIHDHALEEDAYQLPRGRRLSHKARSFVNSSFYAATFASPMKSLVYHFCKHTRRLGEPPAVPTEAKLLAYICSAQAARSRWPAALALGNGFLTKNRIEDGQKVRVIDDIDLYLVMTDEDDPKIISFRDRGLVGYG